MSFLNPNTHQKALKALTDKINADGSGTRGLIQASIEENRRLNEKLSEGIAHTRTRTRRPTRESTT